MLLCLKGLMWSISWHVLRVPLGFEGGSHAAVGWWEALCQPVQRWEIKLPELLLGLHPAHLLVLERKSHSSGIHAVLISLSFAFHPPLSHLQGTCLNRKHQIHVVCG